MCIYTNASASRGLSWPSYPGTKSDFSQLGRWHSLPTIDANIPTLRARLLLVHAFHNRLKRKTRSYIEIALDPWIKEFTVCALFRVGKRKRQSTNSHPNYTSQLRHETRLKSLLQEIMKNRKIGVLRPSSSTVHISKCC
ncbi:uncharacterized protein CIMG_09049 [Coccidioides immitis RS]|uniref:Uncharacterized protein n=1 Tax=Coccidioides immitis (strain RS) TaxID=246410 RepID=A0A0E1RV48_COCIM|nr:uncharacterized protein CIMG_09049 [Coccidioides immitis RS]EAS27845.2 hypothetical protein CIMG_09049 [Coccidioides immitis RS]